MKLYFTFMIASMLHVTSEAFTLSNAGSLSSSPAGSRHGCGTNPPKSIRLSLNHNSHDDIIMKDTSSTATTSTATSTATTTNAINRRNVLRKPFLFTVATGVAATLPSPKQAHALVKGNAPPPPKKVSSAEERKCRNVEECQEMAERLAKIQEEEAKANMTPPSVTARGTRYRDVMEATPSSNGSPLQLAKQGDQATIYFKVLKLGKRSYDGLSGEGTVVFSRGYGLEDDEQKPGDKNFQFVIGDNQVIAALNDAIIGQAVGSTRRFSVLPQMGWELATKACDGGPGGSGSGGDLKTDYAVVPTAKMVDQEACFDKSKLPFPSLYAEQRRMAQRFDQALLMEVELVSLN